MSKLDFCEFFFEYIKDGFTLVTIETKDTFYGVDFMEDTLFLGKNYLVLTQGLGATFKIYYEDINAIAC